MDLLMEYDKVTTKGNVCGALREVQKFYKRVLHAGYEDRERFLLGALKMLARTDMEKYAELLAGIDIILATYPEGHYPHDNSLMKELYNELPSYSDIPIEPFDQIKLLYTLSGGMMVADLKRARSLLVHKSDILMMDNAIRSIRGTFLDDPNFAGSYPYYKRNPQYIRSKLSEEFLDHDFDSYISYFEEALGEDDESGAESV